MAYRDTDFNEWNAEGKKSEDMFPALMGAYGKDVIKHPFGITSIDYGTIDLAEFYEVRQLGKEVEPWQLSALGLNYPMVMDVGKCYKATAFYNSYKDRPQYVFLRLHYEKHWKHLNGWWVIPMYAFLDRFWKDQNAGRGLYTRKKRADEIRTGKTNTMKWHIPIELWSKVAEADGKIIRGYDDVRR